MKTRKTIKKVALILATSLLFALTGCTSPVDIEAEKAAIRELTDIEWMEAGKAKDLDRWVSFHTDDALLFLPGVPIIAGKEAIRAVVSEETSQPGWSARWETTEIEVSRSGDLAYSYGPQENTVDDAEGDPVTSKVKWVATWKKQAGGSWKCAVLIFNADSEAVQ